MKLPDTIVRVKGDIADQLLLIVQKRFELEVFDHLFDFVLTG